MTVLLFGIGGFLIGPLLHGWAVQAGADRDLSVGLSCPSCGDQGRLLSLECHCGRLRWREAALSLLVGLTFAGLVANMGVRPVLVAHLAMVMITAMLIVTDYDHFRIPNSLLFPGTAGCLILLAVASALENTWPEFVRGLIGGLIYFGFLFVVFLAAKGEGFGFGDVKLSALLGLFVTFHSYRSLVWALIITAMLGGVPALILLAMGKGKKTAIPYGPPLIVGAWAAIIFGQQLLA